MKNSQKRVEPFKKKLNFFQESFIVYVYYFPKYGKVASLEDSIRSSIKVKQIKLF